MSNTNKTKEIAGVFGLELGEEFNITNTEKYSAYNPHKFTEEGLIDKDGDGTNLLTSLMLGKYTIEKLPFIPKDGEEYFTYYFSGSDSPFNGRILTNSWEGSPIDKMNKLLGIVFRTEQDARDYLPTFKRRLEGEEV